MHRFFLSLALLLSANCFGAAVAALPARAQAAVDKGVGAAKRADYVEAIRSFEEARKIAPEAPVVFLNLGLAESKLGRQQRAIAWFGAYLAVYPEAPNAGAVRKQMAELLAGSRGTVTRVIGFIRTTALGMATDQERSTYFQDVPELWARAGNLGEAMKSAALLKSFYNSIALESIAEVQAERGDFAGAAKASALIGDPEYRSKALTAIGGAQAARGDRVGAKASFTSAFVATSAITNDSRANDSALSEIATRYAEAGFGPEALAIAERIRDDSFSALAYAGIAVSQAANRDMSGANAALSMARLKAGKVTGAYARAVALTSLADGDVAVRAPESARTNLAEALKSVDLITEMFAVRSKAFAWAGIAGVQAKMGDISAAKKTAGRISVDYPKVNWAALQAIAEAQAKAGDFSGALKTADGIKDPAARGAAINLVAAAQAKKAPKAAASGNLGLAGWLEMLNDANPANACPLNTPTFLDLESQLKLAVQMETPWDMFAQYSRTAKSLGAAQVVLRGKLE